MRDVRDQRGIARAVLGVALLSLLVVSCSLFTTGSGTVTLSLTDAPVDAADVEGVFITIDSIEYHLNGQWVTDTGFTGPRSFNLLELTGGEVALLSETVFDAGEVSQIRFMLAESEKGAASYDHYIAIDPDGVADGNLDDDTRHELFVPSGEQSGYKATGAFTIPVGGSVQITADFDVRKSVKLTGSGSYTLQPTIRLIVNGQAGSIAGTFTEDAVTTYPDYLILAYEDGSYDAATVDAEYLDAVTSISPEASEDDPSQLEYLLPFLAEGTYDLVIVGVAEDGSCTLIDDSTWTDLVVTSEQTTTQAILLSIDVV